jgi:hypothetical protein
VKHSILAIVLATLFLVSCAGTKELQPAKDVYVPVTKAERFNQESRIAMRIEAGKLPAGADVSQAMWDMGLTKGMRVVLNKYLLDGTIFVPSKGQEFFSLPLTRVTLSEEPIRDQVTGDYRQSYLISARFVPDKSLSGTVVNMKGKRTIGAMDDEVFIQFATSDYLESPAYFLIGSPAPFGDGAHYQVFGSGRIKQITGNMGLGEILEVRKEVSAGDLVFLLQIDGKTVAMELPASDAQATPGTDGPDEIVVEPALEVVPVVAEPKELK